MESFPEDWRRAIGAIARATGFTRAELLDLEADDYDWWLDTLGLPR